MSEYCQYLIDEWWNKVPQLIVAGVTRKVHDLSKPAVPQELLDLSRTDSYIFLVRADLCYGKGAARYVWQR